ncbi:MAG: RIP metalloprotease RseP [Lachnospiraceae bacterium]|nr:RIP metalloprotease RseP [Lachnospiraceae bacterium]
MSIVISILFGILLLGLIIVFHEFGHFLLCKMYNIAVPQFFVGFGPKLCSFKKGETLFSIRLLPIGGACQMATSADPDVDPERTINAKKPLIKFCVYIAGPVFNFILAFLVSLIVIGFVGYDSPVVTRVAENGPAYEAGIRPGDIITEYDDMTVNLGRELAVELRYRPLQADPIKMEYERDGETYSTVITPDYRKVYKLGFTYYIDDNPAKIADVSEDGAFYKAGIRKNDIIVAMNGEKISTGGELNSYIGVNPLNGDSIVVTVDRGGVKNDYTVVPIAVEGYDAGLSFNSSYRTEVSGLSVIKYSYYELKYNIVGTIKSLVLLFTGKLTGDDFGGPVKIVEKIDDTIEATEDQGVFIVIMNLINWIILISANLGVMNLLPIPMLDGGRILFALIEVIRRKPIPPEKEGIVNIIGAILLLIVVVLVFFKDIISLFA